MPIVETLAKEGSGENPYPQPSVPVRNIAKWKLWIALDVIKNM